MSNEDLQRQPDRTDIERTQQLLGDRYELNWIIGRGGMSTVWLAWDTQTERDVAVKILKPEYTDNPEFRTRFRNESHAAARLHSENVVETYDYGEVQNGGTVFCFIIMEYVRGESLADVLTRERVLPEALALDVLVQAALGLKAIHEAGMVHRDIKPGNLLITSDGVVKVTDFGIAKAAEAVPLTRTGMVVGTAQYVSPEQAQGQSVGPASDVYSLGVVGFEMFAGHRLFTGESTVSVAIKHISSAPPPLPENISPHMQELINICLRKNPQTRYADGAELAAAAALVAQGQRPPQPHNVPAVSMDPHPLTEQLGTVAHGQGTRVPPMQGPGAGPSVGPGAGSGRPAPTGARPAVAASGAAAGAGAAASTKKKPKKSSGATPVIVLGIVAVLALILAAYLWASGRDDAAPNKETMTVTSEVTSEPNQGNEPARPANPAPQRPQRTTQQQQPERTSEAPATEEQPTQLPSTEPAPPSPNPTNTANTGDLPGGGAGGGNSGESGGGAQNQGQGAGGNGGNSGTGGTTNTASTGTTAGTNMVGSPSNPGTATG